MYDNNALVPQDGYWHKAHIIGKKNARLNEHGQVSLIRCYFLFESLRLPYINISNESRPLQGCFCIYKLS